MEQKDIILLVLFILAIMYFMNNKTETLDNTCNKTSCNNKMKEFIVDNGWSFKNSSNLFTECQHCTPTWYRHSDIKTSENGNKWKKHDSSIDAFNHVKL